MPLAMPQGECRARGETSQWLDRMSNYLTWLVTHHHIHTTCTIRAHSSTNAKNTCAQRQTTSIITTAGVASLPRQAVSPKGCSPKEVNQATKPAGWITAFFSTAMADTQQAAHPGKRARTEEDHATLQARSSTTEVCIAWRWI